MTKKEKEIVEKVVPIKVDSEAKANYRKIVELWKSQNPTRWDERKEELEGILNSME